MSAIDLTGALLGTPLALLYWVAAFTPSKPPHPRYGVREGTCLVIAAGFTAVAVYSIARLLGARP